MGLPVKCSSGDAVPLIPGVTLWMSLAMRTAYGHKCALMAEGHCRLA